MPALVATEHTCTIEWLGHVPDRAAALASTPQDRMVLTFDGPEGEDHGGRERPSCSRVIDLYDRETPIRNARQLSVVSREEMDLIAGRMGVDALDPAWLGATLVLSGLPDLSHLPPSSRIQFAGRGGPTLTVDMENRPCNLPGPIIDAALPGKGRLFKRAAGGLRGITAWVEREGVVVRGQVGRLFVPDQPVWAGS
ncbi:MOSC domain-containing protein [Jannaschia sp. LMIT008]|uniref:MOSC domain-containing protein n=1 Tax=Jannaschia maritima TaxID=3032585 RepID=UPI0028125DA3|nr:sulfurase [Jannaschia sp. LMIT008]